MLNDEQIVDAYMRGSGRIGADHDFHIKGCRAVSAAARAEALESVRKKLLAASKGEPETWGFVAMFMQMIDEVAESKP